MKPPRDVSGSALVTVLCRSWGYTKVNQEGSHVVLQTEQPSHQWTAIPNHKRIRVGTLNTILRAIAAHKNVALKKSGRPCGKELLRIGDEHFVADQV